MGKFNNKAGFKNINEDFSESPQDQDKPISFFAKYKIVFLVAGIVIFILIILVLLISLFQMPAEEPPTEVIETIEATTYDYNVLFSVDPEEDITVPSTTQSSTAPKQTVPPTTVAPVTVYNNRVLPTTAPPQNNNSNNSGNNNSNNSNNSGNNSSNNNGNSGGSSNNNSGNNNSNNSGGSGNSGGSSNNTPNYVPEAPPAAPSTIGVTSISISQASLSLTVGGSATLSATISPSNATNKSITWASSDNSVASVSGGKVVARTAGTAQISASSHNGHKAVCTVQVKDKPQSTPSSNISLSVSEQTIKRGQSITITLNGASKCTWTVSNPFVVTTVSESATKITVKGAKVGVTNIEAVLPNGQKYKAKITVK